MALYSTKDFLPWLYFSSLVIAQTLYTVLLFDGKISLRHYSAVYVKVVRQQQYVYIQYCLHLFRDVKCVCACVCV